MRYANYFTGTAKKSNYVEGDLIHSKTLAIKVYAMAPGIKLVFQKSRARMHLSRLLVIGSRLFLLSMWSRFCTLL